MKDWNAKIIEEFRANEGRVGGQFEGAPMLLLHTKGRKSGEQRVNPMMYRQVGDDVAVFASRGGSPSNPDWYYNAVSEPTAEVEIGTERAVVRVREAKGEERERIWTKQKQDYPGFADYEAATEGIREIPVLILEKVVAG
ncbi:MAG: nitroreductase family deazaflavin-dependent oxidoreductase [Actinomycetota bacterium]